MAGKRETAITSDADRKGRLGDIEKKERQEATERDVAAKNKNFVQLSRDSIPALGRLIATSPSAAVILLSMAEHMGYQNMLGFNADCIQEWTGASRPTVYRGLRKLAEDQWIEAEKNGRNTIYRVNSNVFWAAAQNLKSGSFRPKLASIVPKDSAARKPKVDRKIMPVYALKRPKSAGLLDSK